MRDSEKELKIVRTVSQGTKFFDKHFRYFMVAPAVIALALVIVYPLAVAIRLSLHRVTMVNMTASTWPYVGLGNFTRLLSQVHFQNAAWRTLLYVGAVVILETIAGMLLALAFNRDFRGKNFFSVLLLTATMITPIAIALIWRFMLNTEIGVVNYVIRSILNAAPSWLGSKHLAFLCIVGIDVWWTTPFMFLIFSAGLAALPTEPYEAARIDGASDFQTFTIITIPLMRPVIMVAILIRTMDALKSFDIIYGLTNGGPGTATELLSLYLYKYAFKRVDMGGAAAAAMMVLVVVAVLSYGLFSMLGTNRRDG